MALSIKTAICEQVAAAHAMHHDHLEGGRFTADEISAEVARTDERGRLAAGDVGVTVPTQSLPFNSTKI
jgi:hypothetical protein